MSLSFLDLVVSTIFITFSCLCASFARSITRKCFKDGLVRELIEEAIATADLCICCFELIIVADNFGVATYAVYLFVLTIWWSKVNGNASACPYTHMEDMVEKKTSPREVALKIWAQLMGGCLIYRFVQLFWWFEFVSTHEGRAFERCTADLQVNQYLGAAIELVATLLCRLASRAIGEINPKFATILDSFIGTALVVVAFNYSGGYFNPVLATALKWGCSGNTNIEHIVVYWIGSCTGALLSIPIFNISSVRRLLVGDIDKSKKE